MNKVDLKINTFILSFKLHCQTTFICLLLENMQEKCRSLEQLQCFTMNNNWRLALSKYIKKWSDTQSTATASDLHIHSHLWLCGCWQHTDRLGTAGLCNCDLTGHSGPHTHGSKGACMLWISWFPLLVVFSGLLKKKNNKINKSFTFLQGFYSKYNICYIYTGKFRLAVGCNCHHYHYVSDITWWYEI